jgi:uncharacterized protein
MLNPGKAVKVTIYLSEGATHHGAPVYSSILDFLFYRGVAGATVTKGIAGFGADHHMHSSSKLEELTGSGLIEVQETTVAKPAQVSNPKKTIPPSHLKMEGKAQMMRIFVSEEDRWKNKPLHEALVEAMRANDIAGVTVYRGILGYGAHRRLHKDKPLLSTHHGSVMLSAVDTAQKLRDFLPLVDQMVEEGLVVFSEVDIIKYAYKSLDDGEQMATPPTGNSTA